MNTAPFNPIFASSPKSGWIEFLRNNDYYEPYTRSSYISTTIGSIVGTLDHKFNIYQFNPPTCVPGVPISVLVFISNQQDAKVGLTVSSAKATLSVVNSTENSHFLMNNEAIGMKNGVFNFSQFIVHTTQNATVYLKLEVSGITPPGQRQVVELVKTVFALKFRGCVPGEEFTSDMKCVACRPGTFSAVNSTVKICEPCLLGANCFGGTAMAPKPGYYRRTLQSTDILKCPNEQACLGGSIEKLAGTCAPGYQGVLCSECSPGYISSSTGILECARCPPYEETVTRIIIAVLIGILIAIVVIASVLWSSSCGERLPMLQAYIKIIINHFQIMMVVASVHYKWAKEVKYF